MNEIMLKSNDGKEITISTSGFNIWAFLFNGIYFCFKSDYKLGILAIIFELCLAAGDELLAVLFWVYCGWIGNYRLMYIYNKEKGYAPTTAEGEKWIAEHIKGQFGRF